MSGIVAQQWESNQDTCWSDLGQSKVTSGENDSDQRGEVSNGGRDVKFSLSLGISSTSEESGAFSKSDLKVLVTIIMRFFRLNTQGPGNVCIFSSVCKSVFGRNRQVCNE